MSRNEEPKFEMPTLAILAGGIATRLGSITQQTPKSLIPVAGEPFISRQLRLAKREGVDKVVLCAGYLGEQIQEFVGNGERFGLRVSFSFDGPKLLGTGGALKKALSSLSEVFLVMYGDSYLDTSYATIVDGFRRAGKKGLMAVYCNEDRWDKSNIEFNDGTVVTYDKKKQNTNMKFIDYGLVVLRAEVFETWPGNQPFDLADVYQRLVEEGQMAGYEVSERFYEIGSHQGLEETDQYLSETRKAHVVY